MLNIYNNSCYIQKLTPSFSDSNFIFFKATNPPLISFFALYTLLYKIRKFHI